MKKQLTYAILGAGNGGQAMAGYFSMKGHKIRLFDFFEKTLEDIRSNQCIQLTGAIEGKGYWDVITSNIEEVLLGADMIMVVNPSTYHRKIAELCAPYITENQVIFLQPGSTFGAFAFKKALEDFHCPYDIPVAESNTLLFACRATSPGNVLVGGKKDRLLVATLPACKNQVVADLLIDTIPEIELCDSVLVTSMDNTNPMVHPAPTILNSSWIESDQSFLYYFDGIGKTVATLIEKMDWERIHIAEKLGLTLGQNLFSLAMQYDVEYHAQGNNISEIVKKVDAYEDISGPKSVYTRYIYEDVPMGLVPLVEVGKLLNMPVKNMQLVIDLCETMLNEDFTNDVNNRNLKNLGLQGMDCNELIHYAKTGEK